MGSAIFILFVLIAAAVLVSMGALGQFVVVEEHEAGLLYSNGRFVKRLAAGRYFIHRLLLKQRVFLVDMRLRSTPINGQDIPTKDQINLKFNLIVQFKVVNPEIAVNKVENFLNLLYQETQLALRGLVANQTLDEVLSGKSLTSQSLLDIVKPRVVEYGLDLHSVGIKDVVMPNEIKAILAKALDAEKSAKSALIAAREELAAARCQANTAKVLQENPVILRLKELQTIADAAKKAGNTIVFTGSGDLSTLLAQQSSKPTAT